MTIIEAQVKDQELKVTTEPLVASGGINETTIHFSFCENWTNFVKTAVFADAGKENWYNVVLDANKAVVPAQVTATKGRFWFGVVGIKDQTRYTTKIVQYDVAEGVTLAEEDVEPPQTLIDQLMAALGSVSAEASAVRVEMQIHPTGAPVKDDTVAYIKNVPAASLPAAKINKIGGMTYKDGDTLKSAPVTEVESVGANLFDGEILKGFYDSGNGTYVNSENESCSKNYISILPNTQYCVVGTQNFVIFYDFNQKFISSQYYNSQPFTTPTNARYMRLNFGTADVNNIMLNKGSTALPYRPYTKNTLEIPEAVKPENGINENVYDYIDFEKKQFVKRVEKRVFDGDEEWFISGNRFYTYVSNHKASQGKVLSNMFDCALWDTLYVDISSTGVSTVTEFKSLISANPLNVVYELATPIITDISDILPADNLIAVEGGGTLTFKNEYGYAVPSEVINYLNAATGVIVDGSPALKVGDTIITEAQLNALLGMIN